MNRPPRLALLLAILLGTIALGIGAWIYQTRLADAQGRAMADGLKSALAEPSAQERAQLCDRFQRMLAEIDQTIADLPEDFPADARAEVESNRADLAAKIEALQTGSDP